MGNPQHLEWLLEGVNAWNARREQDDFLPDFENTNIHSAFAQTQRLARNRRIALSGINFSKANLEGAVLENAAAMNADFSGANLIEANLKNANLANAKMINAQIMQTDLTGAHLANTVFCGADLRNSIFFEANLREADFRCGFYSNETAKTWYVTDLQFVIGLSQSQIDSAIGDNAVALPDDLVRPDHWGDVEMPWKPTNYHMETAPRNLPGFIPKQTQQIGNILAHANLHRVQAPVIAELIRVAVRTSLPQGTNDLPQVFRIAMDVAELLERLDPDDAHLRDRIAELEAQVAALTEALQDAEARAEVEAALAEGYKAELANTDATAEGFWASYRKTTGAEVAKHQFFFAKAGFLYYLATLLGPNHPLIKLLFELVGKL